MFIKSSVNATIKDNVKGLLFNIPNNYIGLVPDWVENNWYFKGLCQDGKISFIDKNVKDSELEQIDKRMQERNLEKERKIIEQKETDEKILEATKQAEQKVSGQNLDEVTKKNFVKQEVEKAIKKK